MQTNIENGIEKLSLRKYAATLGISHTAVAKAVKSEHILKGWDKEAKKIIVSIANDEWGNAIKERNGTQKNNSLPGINENLLNETLLSDIDLPQVRTDITFTEARRRKEIYYAESARIAAHKEQGLYVEKDKVYSQLFEFGKQLRVSLQSVPDRIIDKIMVAKNRHEGYLILLEEINKTLEQLSNVPEF